MKLLKVLGCILLLSLLSACTCKPHKMIGSEDQNISLGDTDGPLKDINFAFDSYALTDAAKATLKANAEWISANPGKKVQIEGHCDERGTNEYNMVLGANRAKAAQSYLQSLGTPASVLSTISYGEDVPADPAHNEAAWAKNRRDHFRVN